MGRGGERMSDEISQAIQIIRLEFDGLRFGMNVTGTKAKQVKRWNSEAGKKSGSVHLCTAYKRKDSGKDIIKKDAE